MRTYSQLTREERYQIYMLMQAGRKQGEIAKLLGRRRATNSRELCRNRGMKRYRPKQAHRMALTRRMAKVFPRFSSPIWQQVELLIQRDWSLEKISG